MCFQGLPGKKGVYWFRYCDLFSCRDPFIDFITSLCTTQSIHGVSGTIGLPGIKGDMVGFHYVLHPVGIFNVVKQI